MEALFDRPVVIKPPDVVAAHDFLLIGWILLLLLGTPVLAFSGLMLAVGMLGYLGYTAAQIVTMLFTGVALIDGWTVYFAFSFSWTMVLSMGAVAVTCFLVIIISIYFTTVRRTNTGNYEGARSSSLFFSVLLMLISAASIIAVIIIITYAMSGYGFFLAGGILIFPALFFFMGYGKMGEVIARYGPMAVLSDASPVETMSPVPSGAIGPAIPIMPGPAMGMGGMAVPVASMGTAAIPAPPASPQYQHLGGAVPRVPLCPSCGRELYYASNYKRWYCLVCESRR